MPSENHIDGETVSAKAIGRKTKHKFMWATCPDCGKGRWVQQKRYNFHKQRGYIQPCLPCANKRRSRDSKGDKGANWKGGRVEIGGGYIGIYLNKNDPFISMADKRGYAREHRVVMARHIGRCLLKDEVIHHKNRDKKDNRIENLGICVNNAKHMKEHAGEHVAEKLRGYEDGFKRGYADGVAKAMREAKNK